MEKRGRGFTKNLKLCYSFLGNPPAKTRGLDLLCGREADDFGDGHQIAACTFLPPLDLLFLGTPTVSHKDT